MPRLLSMVFFFWAIVCCAHAPLEAENKPAARNGKAAAVRWAVIGDFGFAGPDEQAVADMVHQWQPDFIATLGDNNYPNGSQDTIDANIGAYYKDYIVFGSAYQGVYKNQSPNQVNRFFPVLGNHDWRTPQADPYLKYFSLPGNKRYYTIRKGPVALFALDSDSHEPDGNTVDSIQAQWLKDELAASDAPWKIVTMHHPPYSSGEHGSSAWMQWPYRQWGADVVMAGHDHHYERLIVDDLLYFVVGCSGMHLRPVSKAHVDSARVDIVHDGSFGAMIVEANNQEIRFHFANTKGDYHDDYSLQKISKNRL